MTQARLSWEERKLLEVWLPRESPLGEAQTDARSLVAQWQTLSAEEVVDRLDKVRRNLRELQTERSLLDARAPIGRGHVVDHEMAWPSPWEDAWLAVDRLHARGELLTIDPEVLAAELSSTVLGAVAIAVVCLEDAGEGQRLAQTMAAHPACPEEERAWLAWLGGDEDIALAEHLDDETLVCETPSRSLAAALRGNWTEVEARLPKGMKKALPKVLRPSVTKMHGQFLAQLGQHVLLGEPSRAVIDASLGVLFAHYGSTREDWWNGTDVVTRLPLLAAYRRALGVTTTPATLLHAQRVHIEHVVKPPPRTYAAPPTVVSALGTLEAILADAASEKRGLDVELGPPFNVYTIV